MAQEADELPGYQRGEPIHDSSASAVYRARRSADGAAVVIKRSLGSAVSARQLTRYRNEYELLRSLDSEGIVKVYDLVRQDGQIALVLQDLPGTSLRRWIESHVAASLAERLHIAVQLAAIVARRACGEHHSQGHQQPQLRLRRRLRPLQAHRFRHRDAVAYRGEQVPSTGLPRGNARLHCARADRPHEPQLRLSRGSVFARRDALRAIHRRLAARQRRPAGDGALSHRG